MVLIANQPLIIRALVALDTDGAAMLLLCLSTRSKKRAGDLAVAVAVAVAVTVTDGDGDDRGCRWWSGPYLA